TRIRGKRSLLHSCPFVAIRGSTLFVFLICVHLRSSAVEMMPLEIEAKMKVADFEPVRARLRKLGATRVGEVLETNAFFETADHALLREDRGLRLRTNRN